MVVEQADFFSAVDAVQALDLKVTLLTGGAIENRGFWVQRTFE